MPTFIPPTAPTIPPFLPDTKGAEWGLAKYRNALSAGVAVYKLYNTVTKAVTYVQDYPTAENQNTNIPPYPLMPDQTNPNIVSVVYTGATPGNPPTRQETDINPYVIFIYYGGHRYTVSSAEAARLTAAGYADCLT